MTPELIPARINLQIREGGQNVLSEFEVESHASRKGDDGNTLHDVSLHSIVMGLAKALAKEADELLDASKPADRKANKGWLDDVRDWIFGGLK